MSNRTERKNEKRGKVGRREGDRGERDEQTQTETERERERERERESAGHFLASHYYSPVQLSVFKVNLIVSFSSV